MMTDEQLLQYIKPNMDKLLSPKPVRCPLPFCGCSAPYCRIKELLSKMEQTVHSDKKSDKRFE